jgi:2,3-bisphosphoglycerate-dependent phosphoglycerate mutase
MFEVLVLRHGQSLADLEGRHEGRYDAPLTEHGRDQARLAATWIARHCPPAVLYASPLRRAAETAEILCRHIGVPVQYDEGLMEFDNGALAGLTWAEAAARYPEPPGGYKPHEPVPDGECDLTFRVRAEMVWSRLVNSAAEGQRLGIVAHGGIISRLCHSFLNLPMQTNVRLVTGDTGLHLWRIESTQRSILFANRTDHLATDISDHKW